MNVVWLPEARQDVARIKEQGDGWSPGAGSRLAEGILARAEQIAQFPDSGRMIPEFQLARLREVLEGEFRILYERFPDRIEVFGVLSGRQQLIPDGRPPTA